jgi:hypothetical protein
MRSGREEELKLLTALRDGGPPDMWQPDFFLSRDKRPVLNDGILLIDHPKHGKVRYRASYEPDTALLSLGLSHEEGCWHVIQKTVDWFRDYCYAVRGRAVRETAVRVISSNGKDEYDGALWLWFEIYIGGE